MVIPLWKTIMSAETNERRRWRAFLAPLSTKTISASVPLIGEEEGRKVFFRREREREREEKQKHITNTRALGFALLKRAES
jgi:hypothetical protein